MALSVTPAYLQKLGILKDVPKNDKALINLQMKDALEKIAFLPFGLLVAWLLARFVFDFDDHQLFGVAVLIPLILGYTGWAYWVFRGKVKAGSGYH